MCITPQKSPFCAKQLSTKVLFKAKTSKSNVLKRAKIVFLSNLWAVVFTLTKHQENCDISIARLSPIEKKVEKAAHASSFFVKSSPGLYSDAKNSTLVVGHQGNDSIRKEVSTHCCCYCKSFFLLSFLLTHPGYPSYLYQAQSQDSSG